MLPQYKVLITTSGIGSRLGDLTKKLNKALIPVGNKTAIDIILDSYPLTVPIVITLGYKKAQVKKYLLSNYPNRNFEFVTVDKYVGPGTSCGYSILSAKKKLQCPFIFHACDTLVFEPIPAPMKNWTAGYKNSHLDDSVVMENFTTQLVNKNKLIKINPLGTKKYTYIHIGITAIHDFKPFWESLEELYKKDTFGQKLTDIHLINELIKKGYQFDAIPFKVWLDTGNPQTLNYTRNYFSQNNL